MHLENLLVMSITCPHPIHFRSLPRNKDTSWFRIHHRIVPRAHDITQNYIGIGVARSNSLFSKKKNFIFESFNAQKPKETPCFETLLCDRVLLRLFVIKLKTLLRWALHFLFFFLSFWESIFFNCGRLWCTQIIRFNVGLYIYIVLPSTWARGVWS